MTCAEPPSVAVVMLLPQCNMTCSFCVTEDVMGAFDLPQACMLLDRLRDERFTSVVIGGGEPTLWRPGLFRLTAEAKARGFVVQVGTNGILLPAGFESIDTIDRFVLPLDGATADVHNAVRFIRARHFDVVMDRLERLRASGKPTTISTVITRLNHHDVINVAELLSDLNHPRPFIHAWHLYQFIPEGRGGGVNRELLSLPGERYHAIADEVKRMDLGFTVFKRPQMLHSRSVEFFWMHGGQLHRQLGQRLRVEALSDRGSGPSLTVAPGDS